MTAAGTAATASERPLAAGDGWRVIDHVCRAGPSDPAFEERHAHTSVAVVLEGSFVYRSHGGRVLMAPGSVLLGNHGACFACSHEHGRGDRCVSFQFDPGFVEQAAAQLHDVARPDFARHRLPPLEELAPLAAGAAELTRSPDPAEAEELGTALLSAALRLAHGAVVRPVTVRDEARVAAVLRLIDSGSADGIGLAGMAEAAGLTRHHFLRVFAAVVGVTPHRYLLARRLSAAAAALRAQPDRVLDVALATGFSDLSEFTRRFRRRFGVPPGAYRRRHRPGA